MDNYINAKKYLLKNTDLSIKGLVLMAYLVCMESNIKSRTKSNYCKITNNMIREVINANDSILKMTFDELNKKGFIHLIEMSVDGKIVNRYYKVSDQRLYSLISNSANNV